MSVPFDRFRGAAAELASRKFGGRITELVGNPSIGTAVMQIADGDPERVLLTIVNLSANQVFVGWRPDVSASNGIVLGPNGGSMTLDAEADATLVTRQTFAVADGAASQLFRLTLRRDTETEPDDPFDAII